MLVDLEGHGREDVFDDVDLARTVGWFTTLFPVRVDPGAVDPTDFARGGAGVGVALRRVKEELRAVPDRGLGYGILRHLDPAAGEELGAAPIPQLLFNYLGRFAVQDGAPWTPAPDAPPLGDLRDPGMPMGHALDVDAVVRDGEDGPRLSTVFAWPSEIFGREDIAALGELWLRGARRAARPRRAARARAATRRRTSRSSRSTRPRSTRSRQPCPRSTTSCRRPRCRRASSSTRSPTRTRRTSTSSSTRSTCAARSTRRGCAPPWTRLLERHPPLRASFHQRADGHVVQVIGAGLEVPWREVDRVGDDAGDATRWRARRPRGASTSATRRCCAAR